MKNIQPMTTTERQKRFRENFGGERFSVTIGEEAAIALQVICQQENASKRAAVEAALIDYATRVIPAD